MLAPRWPLHPGPACMDPWTSLLGPSDRPAQTTLLTGCLGGTDPDWSCSRCLSFRTRDKALPWPGMTPFHRGRARPWTKTERWHIGRNSQCLAWGFAQMWTNLITHSPGGNVTGAQASLSLQEALWTPCDERRLSPFHREVWKSPWNGSHLGILQCWALAERTALGFSS